MLRKACNPGIARLSYFVRKKKGVRCGGVGNSTNYGRRREVVLEKQSGGKNPRKQTLDDYGASESELTSACWICGKSMSRIIAETSKWRKSGTRIKKNEARWCQQRWHRVIYVNCGYIYATLFFYKYQYFGFRSRCMRAILIVGFK
jgi:hypothetical protein